MRLEPFGKYIAAIYRHQQILINHYLNPYQIGSGQFIFLLSIDEHEGISQKELSKLIKIDKTTTTKALKKLEDEGYISRVQDLSDRRYYKLYLTLKGRNFIPILRKILGEITDMLSRGMTDDEHKETIKSLEIILNNVQESVEAIKNEKES